MTTYVPKRDLAHLSRPWYHLGNSDHGDRWALARGKRWTDNDIQPAKRVRRTGPRPLMNAHWPMLRRDDFVPHSDRRKVSDLTPAQLKALVAGDGTRMRTILESLTAAYELGLDRELEAKCLLTRAELQVIADHAESLWGPSWAEHVNLKCQTAIFGWRRILRRAHAVGIPTLLLCRGRWASRRVEKPYITYTRGNARAQKERA